MDTKRYWRRVITGLIVCGGITGTASAQPRVDEILARKPVQAGVAVSTPTGAEMSSLRAEEMTWPKGNNDATPRGVVVRDSQGRLVRQFIDTSGRSRHNIFSFYDNGVESYRELDTNGDGKPDQFRWLGTNGSKWGEDRNGDGVVDRWFVLSPQELSQELFELLINRDARRLAALVVTEEELKAAGFSDSEVTKMIRRTANVNKRINETIQALNPSKDARWIHLETGVPHTTPGDAIGSRSDITVYKNATVLFDKGDGKSADAFQLGEIVLVGRSWKLVDGPQPGHAPIGSDPTSGVDVVPAELRELVSQLEQIQPPSDPSPESGAKYHVARASVLEQIVGKTQGSQQEPWLKQVIDAYTAAAEAGDERAMRRLKQWNDSINSAAKGSSAAAYSSFRVMAAEYTQRLTNIGKDDDVMKIQEWWRTELENFLKQFPDAEDAPEATLRLAVAYEFAESNGEAQAKKWYEQLAKNFADHPYAAKATGAVRRLESEGQPFRLSGATIDSGRSFDFSQLNGKPALVYYWASWSRSSEAELKQLADLAKAYADKDLQIVTICLDNEPSQASKLLATANLTGHHLFEEGGLDASPMAVNYGIQMVPHVFLVDKTGKVVNRNAQAGPMLKDEVEKLVR